MNNTLAALAFSSFLIFFSVNGKTQATNKIDTTGNVGIGTTAPATKLHVYGPSLTASLSSDNEFVRFHGNAGPVLAFGNNTTTPYSMYLQSKYASQPWTLVLNPLGGNVGIGTQNPLTTLDVVGGISVQNNNNITWGGAYGANVPTISAVTGTGLYFYPTGSTSGALFSLQNSAATFYTNLSVSGNIGIGTSSPTEKLSVDGNISANGFIKTKKLTVTQLGWSDYVFDDDYKLRSLSSLELFIKQNKHLPDIPSAKEVEENGISVGDNQALLLKKIEELTLYVIELKKQNESQQKQLENQQKQINQLKNDRVSGIN